MSRRVPTTARPSPTTDSSLARLAVIVPNPAPRLSLSPTTLHSTAMCSATASAALRRRASVAVARGRMPTRRPSPSTTATPNALPVISSARAATRRGASYATHTIGRTRLNPTGSIAATLAAPAPQRRSPLGGGSDSRPKCDDESVNRLHSIVASPPCASRSSAPPNLQVAHRDRGTDRISGSQKTMPAALVEPSRRMVSLLRIGRGSVGSGYIMRSERCIDRSGTVARDFPAKSASRRVRSPMPPDPLFHHPLLSVRSVGTLGHGRDELPEGARLLQTAGPDELPVVDRHVGAAVAHVGGPVLEHLARLDDEDRLQVQLAERFEGTPRQRSRPRRRRVAHAAVERPRAEQHRAPDREHRRRRVAHVAAGPQVVRALGHLEELRPDPTVGLPRGGHAHREQPLERV